MAKKIIGKKRCKDIKFDVIKKGICIRNLFIHQDGIIHPKFVKKAGLNPSDYVEGSRYKLSRKEYNDYRWAIEGFISALDFENRESYISFIMDMIDSLSMPK